MIQTIKFAESTTIDDNNDRLSNEPTQHVHSEQSVPFVTLNKYWLYTGPLYTLSRNEFRRKEGTIVYSTKTTQHMRTRKRLGFIGSRGHIMETDHNRIRARSRTKRLGNRLVPKSLTFGITICRH